MRRVHVSLIAIAVIVVVALAGHRAVPAANRAGR